MAACLNDDQIAVSDFRVGKEYWVEVTHINDPNSFYVRQIAARSELNTLEVPGAKIKNEEDIVMKQIYIFESYKLGKYVRGKITNHHNDVEPTYELFIVDYGCSEDAVPVHRIYNPLKTVPIPPLAAHCTLANCLPRGPNWDLEAIEAMITFVGNERALMLVNSQLGNKLIVDLQNTCPNDIATMLALTNFTTLGGVWVSSANPQNQEDLTFKPPPINFKSLPVNTCLRVRVQTGDSWRGFYVAEVDEYKKYLEDKIKFTAFSKNQCRATDDDLVIGKMLAYKTPCDTMYERVMVLSGEKKENKVMCQRIDWGNKIEAPLLHLKRIEKKYFIEKPPIAIYCSVNQILVWEKQLLKCLHPGSEFYVRVLESGIGFEKPNRVQIATYYLT